MSQNSKSFYRAYIRYYGHKKRNDVIEDSANIQENLLALSRNPPNQPLEDALLRIFDSEAWREQKPAVDVALLNDPAIRKKETDIDGNDWFPCQLGCPGGLAETQTGKQGKKTKQAGHATTHIEWHLGMHRYVCEVW